MIPTYRNSSSFSSPSFPFELNDEVHDLSHPPLVSPNFQVASSSSYSSCQTFFNSTIDHHQDQTAYYHPEFYHQPEADKYASRSGSHDDHLAKKPKGESSFKLTLWKKGDRYEKVIKNSDGANMEAKSTTNHITHTKMKLQDQKLSSPMETDYSSNSSCNNSNNNIPIRVCSDCNTTKTPLWRSGPKGPKSLCNACGIRQRKARRAMAAAAANGTNFTAETSTATVKIKVQQQKQKITKVDTKHVVPFKKRCKFINNSTTSTATAAGSSSSNNNNATKKKLCFEDFFINLSNNLAFHRVFPQDEKEAAILLMAISSGLVHG